MNNKSFVLSIIAIAVIGLVLIIAKSFYPSESIIDPGSIDGFFSIKPVIWTDPDNPMQSGYLEESEVPKDAINIIVSAQGFTPDSFEVARGKKIVLAVTNGDEWSHIFKFWDESLKEIAVAVAPGKTSAITFYAPDEPGEYDFHCGIAGHTTRGEIGKMIVK